jgi:hypothetical protein
MKGKWVSVSTHEPWWLFEQLSCIATLLAVLVLHRRGHRYGLEAVEQSCDILGSILFSVMIGHMLAEDSVRIGQIHGVSIAGVSTEVKHFRLLGSKA